MPETVDQSQFLVWGVSMVLSIAAGIILYRDAKSRDYMPILWGLVFPVLGILTPGNPFHIVFLIVGIPGYILLRPKGVLKTCPHCSRKTLDMLAFCPHCKREVKKECLKCHDLADYDARKCPHCGAPMPRYDQYRN